MGLSQRRLGYLREVEERETGELKLIFEREHILIQPEDRKVLEDWFRDRQQQIWQKRDE